MADPNNAERTVLKVLTGAQAGVEVYLEPAEYVIGTGLDDDIQFIDVSMKPGHVRVRVAPGKIEIKAGSGSFFTAAGLHPEDADWQEISPLDVITTGTTRFAFGPPTAQWSTIADHGDAATASTQRRAKDNKSSSGGRFRYLSIPAAFLVGALMIGGLALATGNGHILSSAIQPIDDVAAIRKALDGFSFGRSIAVQKTVDGQIYVNGFVDTTVERRALTGAIQDTGVSVNLRLGVLDVLRSEIDGVIKADDVKVTYDLSASGVLTLNGVILDSAAADRFVNEVSQTVIGLESVDSKIRTAQNLLVDIRDLAHLSQIDDTVVFRLDGTTVDATGVISTSKIDAWVGFLQAYSRRLGEVIGLRSYVQLEQDAGGGNNDPSALPQMPLEIGALPPGQNADIDLARLRSGDFDPKDTFARSHAGPPTAANSGAGNAAHSLPSGSGFLPGPIASPQILDELDALKNAPPISSPVVVASAATQNAQAAKDPASAAKTKPAPPASQLTNNELDDVAGRADDLMNRWLGGQLGTHKDDSAKDSAISSALDMLAHASLGLAGQPAPPPPKPASKSAPPPPPTIVSESFKESFAHKYLPLFAVSRAPGAADETACRPGSRLTVQNLPATLFWLDLMSTTNAMTLQDFSMASQGMILEAALNPDLAADCLKHDPPTAGLLKTSIYLAEAAHDPEFVRFVTQSLPAFKLDVAGAGLWRPRFVELVDGTILHEGEAPDEESRIDTVGELGLSIRTPEGFSTVIYGDSVSWIGDR